MKNLLIILLAAIFYSGNSFAQTKIEKIFKKENYYDVIQSLKEKEKESSLTLNDSELLALSYYYNNDYSSAYVYFEKIIDNKLFSNKNKFYYSHCLKAMGNDTLSNTYLKDYYRDNNINYDKNFEDLETIKRLGNRFKIKNIEKVNSEYSDLFSQDNDGLLYFSSTRPNKLEASKYKWNNQPYLDAFILKKDSTVTSLNAINTDYHDSDVNINKLNGMMYFTSSKPDPTVYLKKDQVITTKIYQAIYENGSLKKLICLPFNSNDYSCKTPFVDYENGKLYFSSNKPGGIGGFDIYYVDINDPIVMINLGNEINSINDEDNFYIDKIRNMYFSSNGYVGFGGKDIFTKIYDTKNKSYKRVMNVGLPVNSKYDDFGYRNIDDNGFFNSNRKPSKGDDDIYSFKVQKPLELDLILQTMSGFVLDINTKLPIKNAKILLKDVSSGEVKEMTTDETGKYNFDLYGNTDYVLTASAKTYKVSTVPFKTGPIKYFTFNKDIALETAECLQKYSGIVKDTKNNLPLSDVLINLYDTSNNLIRSVKTNEKGEYILMAPCNKTMEIRASLNDSEDPFYAEYREFIETDDAYDKEHTKNIGLIPVDSRGLISDKNGNVLIPTKPIYFAYNSAAIEQVSFIELDKVSALLKENSRWKLYIEAHSDMRGTDKYNLSLSIKRAESTKNYLIKSGIEPGRIFSKGYGESKPLIDCVTKECSEEEHGINRRSEFIIK